MGCGKVDDSLPVAINGSWKIRTVMQCLHKLHEIGVRVVSLTCDGASCHFSMMQALGAKMTVENMRPSFPHPANQT